MNAATRTRPETVIEVNGDVVRPRCRLAAGLLSPKRLPASPGTVRVALVATTALLLDGDHVRTRIEVDGPHLLEIVEVAGTVAYHMRGGQASWGVRAELHGGAGLIWHGQPFVVSDGADVSRHAVVRLGEDCVALLRETLVFGRQGQRGGSLTSRTTAVQAESPILREDLDLSPPARASWLTMHRARCLDSITAVGHRLPEHPAVLQLDRTGSVQRQLTDELHHSTVPRAWETAVQAHRDQRDDAGHGAHRAAATRSP